MARSVRVFANRRVSTPSIVNVASRRSVVAGGRDPRQLRIEDVERERAAGRQVLADVGERRELRRHVEQVLEGAERDVTSGKRRAPRSNVSMRPSTSSRFGGGFFARSTASIAGDASTPTHGIPSAAIGSSTRPVPHAELQHRAAALLRERAIERGVARRIAHDAVERVVVAREPPFVFVGHGDRLAPAMPPALGQISEDLRGRVAHPEGARRHLRSGRDAGRAAAPGAASSATRCTRSPPTATSPGTGS